MENNDWDEVLKDKLDNFQPEDITPDWEAFSNYLFVHEQTSLLEEDEIFDETVKESLTGFEASPDMIGWDRIDASLNLADDQFDAHIREKVKDFHPEAKRHTWPMMLARISRTAYLRSKLIAFKVVEVAAVLLLLFTFIKMGQMGKLPFETPIFDDKSTPVMDKANVEMANNTGENNSDVTTNPTDVTDEKIISSGDTEAKALLLHDQQVASNTLASKKEPSTRSRQHDDSQESIMAHAVPDYTTNPLHTTPMTGIQSSPTVDPLINIDYHATVEIVDGAAKEKESKRNRKEIGVQIGPRITGSTSFMASILSPVKWNKQQSLPKPTFIRQRSKTFTEFGIITQLDYNRLRMPEDILISAGRQITFPQQGIPSSGMGGGFSFALAHPKWAIETGVLYTPKKFKPGRQLVVGGAFDNGSVEFEAMRLQMVSIPFQFRYKIDSKGPWHIYAMAGTGLHLIAQADVDVVIKYHFPSLSFGGDPTKDPALAETIRETRRVSEHIRDGAPFSSKSFFSINAGCGFEYTVTETKTLFLQSVIQYQAPNLQFSNNNGKHLRSVALQAGVRTPLGK